jgi:hypothetical protein
MLREYHELAFELQPEGSWHVASLSHVASA